MEIINDIRAWYTVVMLVMFLGIVWWAYSGRQKRRFDEAARLPFTEPEHPRGERSPTSNATSGDRP